MFAHPDKTTVVCERPPGFTIIHPPPPKWKRALNTVFNSYLFVSLFGDWYMAFDLFTEYSRIRVGLAATVHKNSQALHVDLDFIFVRCGFTVDRSPRQPKSEDKDIILRLGKTTFKWVYPWRKE